MIPKHTVDAIMEATQIEEVVGDFVELKKSGSSYKALSPFSQEKTPSFFVVPHKGIFKDFSSGKGGNAVHFLMEHQGMSYPEALRWLARKYNIAVEEERQAEADEGQQEKDALYILLKYARDFYRRYLFESEEGRTIGRPYLAERGIEKATAEAFELGLSPDAYDGFYRQALQDGFTEEKMEQAGLIKEGRRGGKIDVFRNRLMFPIHDPSGKVLGFGARLLRNSDKAPKYLNTPETPVYHKGEVLYGLYQARPEMQRMERAILVEGYTDVLALHQCGIRYAIAASGTSLTEEQVRRLKRHVRELWLFFDGDAAGQRASLRGIDLLLAAELTVRVVVAPEGEDPDSFARDRNAEEVRRYLESAAEDFIFFKTRRLLNQYGEDPVRKAQVVRELTESLSKMPDSVARALYIKECARLLGLEERILYLELNKHLRDQIERVRRQNEREADYEEHQETPLPGEERPVPQPRPLRPPEEAQERELIRLLLHYGHRPYRRSDAATPARDDQTPSLSDYLLSEFSELEWKSDTAKAVFDRFYESWQQGAVPEWEDFLRHPDPKVAEMVAKLTAPGHHLSKHWEARTGRPVVRPGDRYQTEVDSALRHLLLRKLDRQMRDALEELKSASDPAEEEEWMRVIQWIKEQEKEVTGGQEIVLLA
jgi:DNA primase